MGLELFLPLDSEYDARFETGKNFKQSNGDFLTPNIRWNFSDVSDEIFDMVRPADPCKITLRDMIDCGQGDTVVRILIDLNEFWIYKNRESLLAEQED